MTDLAQAFKTFASKAEGKEQTTADFTKWCKDAGILGKNCNSNHVDISFSKAKAKGTRNITIDNLETLVAEMAKKYKDDCKCDEEFAKSEIKSKLSMAQKHLHGTKTLNVGGVDKLTDTSQYTGSHKSRFDESGKGKGLAGRTDAVENTGYVSGFKGADSHETK